MKKLSLAAGLVALGLSAFAAQAAEKVTLQLKWVTQAQFAGYYVAQDKGFYKDAGLDVTLKAGGPDLAPEQVIAGGGADVIVTGCPQLWPRAKKGQPSSTSPSLSKSGPDADLPQGNRHCLARRLQGQDLGRVVLWQ